MEKTTTREKKNLFLDLFVNRTDAWIEQQERDYTGMKGELKTSHFQQHLDGKITLAMYAVSKEGTCKWGMLDVDSKQRRDDIKKLMAACKKLGLFPFAEDSGNKGYHVWVLFSRPEPVEKTYNFLKYVVESCGLTTEPDKEKGVEIFPHSPVFDAEKFGKGGKLPLGINKKTDQRCLILDEKLNGLSIDAGLKILQEVKRGECPEVPKKIAEAVPLVKTSSGGTTPSIVKKFTNEEGDSLSEEIKARLTLFDLGLKAGEGQACSLPGHATPEGHSSVSEDGKLWKCHRNPDIHGGGDLFSFYMKKNGVSFPQAVEELAKKAGISPQKLVESEGFSKKNTPNTKIPQYTKHQNTPIDLVNILTSKYEQNTKIHQNQTGILTSKLPNTTPFRGVGNLFSMPEPIQNTNIHAFQLSQVPKELCKPPEWHLEGIIPKGGKVFIASPVYSFKSTVALYVAVHLAAGKKVWTGSAPEPTRVWYIDEEDSWGHLIEVVNLIKSTFNDEEKKLVDANFILSSGQAINEERVVELYHALAEIAPQVVFVDTLRKLTFDDENKSDVINRIDSLVLSPAVNAVGLSWVLMHHNAKKRENDTRSADDIEQMRGSGAIGAIATTIIMLEKLRDNELIFSISKQKWRKATARLLYLRRDDKQLSFEDGGDVEVGLQAVGKMALRIKQTLLKKGIFEGITTAQLEEEFGKNGSVSRAITSLKDCGFLVGTGKKNRSPFRIAETQQTKQAIIGDDDNDKN